MPRPSLETVRREEILEAFVRSVACFGLEGATQERIAEAAGVKRPILRHYLGNRDAMIAALIDHLADRFDAETAALGRALPHDVSGAGRVEAMLELLFGPRSATPAETVLAFQAIVAAAPRYPKARTAMLASVTRFHDLVEAELSAAYPKAPADEIAAVAFGLVSLTFNLDALAPLRPPRAWRSAAGRAARSLVETLGDKNDG